jgi:hypothetical protein
MKVIAVIQVAWPSSERCERPVPDSIEIKKILAHLVKIGRAPPGFDPSLLN